MRGLMFGLLITLVAIAALVVLGFRPALITGANEQSLAYSVQKEAGFTEAVCRGEDDRFMCVARSDRGPVRYSIDVDTWGCWEASAKSGGDDLDGCITIFDLIRLDE